MKASTNAEQLHQMIDTWQSSANNTSTAHA